MPPNDTVKISALTSGRLVFLSLWKDPVLWFVLTLGFAFGFIYNVLPISFPAFQGDFRASLQKLALTQTVFFCSALTVSVFAGFLNHRLRIAAVSSAGAVALGLLVIGSSTYFDMVVAGAYIFGLGVATLNVVSNALISDRFGVRRQSILFVWGIIDAVGAIVGPTLLGRWMIPSGDRSATWRSACFVIAFFMALLALWGALMRSSMFGYPDQTEAVRAGRSSFKSVAGNPAIYAIGIGLCLHSVSQVGMISWIGQVYQLRTPGLTQAGYFMSANAAGFFAGRSLLTWITAQWKIPELLVLGCCATAGALAFGMTLLAPNYLSGVLLFAIAGIFVSGNAPSLYSFTGLRFAGQTATAFGILTGIGNFGGAGGMYLTGFLGSSLGIGTSIWLMPVFSLALGALALGWYVRSGKRRDLTQ